ncbi:hypothetical protein Pla52o_05700 [Novipirellula galeiformis]|uniref:SHOCT domain-containing protein n=1 Tax=Novipirellula galeiformis TaxID=2528004 RepID=A0A5C6CT53_9BACT|nr:hypothetical protein [Novipirellula galeiformis]TWU26717.1 hypothetical protein Pla52o_05700 [Novipirellula galeiformis]
MPDIFLNTTVQAGLSLLILCILIAAAFYLVSSYRGYNANDRDTACDTLANLKEMHLRGDISEAEYRTIETTTRRQLADRIQSEPSRPQDEGAAEA